MRVTRPSAPGEPTEELPHRPPLTRGARGEAVRTAQARLLRAGYSLTRYGADGRYGPETTEAVKRFQRASGLPGTGALDDRTLRALEGARSKSPAYEALFADGELHVALALGHDETGAHLPEHEELLRGLAQRGYAWLTAGERQARGLPDDGAFLQRVTGETRVLLELITPDVPRAKERFAAALARDEVVLYGGHGRYGSGPDFDDLHSPAGNFVIGAPFEAGHVTLGANDLERTALPRGYQLLFFDGCNTERYFDDLRARAAGKTSANLDLVGSTSELFWHVTAENLLTTLDAISDREDLGTLTRRLDLVNGASRENRPLFRGDGFDDN